MPEPKRNLRGVWENIAPLPVDEDAARSCSFCWIHATNYGVRLMAHPHYPGLLQCPSCGRVTILTESLT